MLAALRVTGVLIYTPFAARFSQCLGNDVTASTKATKDDPWTDGHTRGSVYPEAESCPPNSEFRDLDPILDALRAVRARARLRSFARHSHSRLGIMEAMRDARPGMLEYELQPTPNSFSRNTALRGGVLCPRGTGKNTISRITIRV